METRITQCPRCGTSFRVTDALLAVAAGAVRCGSCLHIFNARDHWLDDKKPAATPATASGLDTARVAAPAAPAIVDDRREPTFDEDGLFDDDTPLFGEEPVVEEHVSSRSIFNPGDTDFMAADDDAPIENSRLGNDFLDASDWLTPNPINFTENSFGESAGGSEEKLDESWVEELLREDSPIREEFEDEEADILSAADRGIERPAIISDPGGFRFDDRTDEHLEDSADTRLDADPLTPDDILAQVPETADEDIVLDLPSAYDPGLRAIPADEPAPAPEERSFAAIDNGDFNAGDRIGDEHLPPSLRALDAAPIRMHQFVRERRWPKLLWRFGLIVALALLPAQYLYFNFGTLARGELRPWLAQACGLIGCQLPPQSDAARIRTGSLIVRSHPTAQGALAVDAIITNLAPFAQPYPELVLQFTDIDGKPVAGRRFTPGEYLGGELTGSRLMPIGQPIHIGLEVRDPGPAAVNYLLTVSAAKD